MRIVGQIPIGAVTAWLKSFTGVPQTLPAEFVECNGQTLSDPGSPLNGQTIPNLNGQSYFLRGGGVSGGPGGTTAHSHSLDETAGNAAAGSDLPVFTSTDEQDHLPPYYGVVWIIRIK
jgi:hypothetical protein